MAKSKSKSNSKSKGKNSTKKGKKKSKEYLLSPAQDKQLKDVLEDYRQADDSKNTKQVEEILNRMSEKFIQESEVEDEEEKAKIKAVGYLPPTLQRPPADTKIAQAVAKWLRIKASKLRKNLRDIRPKIMTGIRVFNNMEWSTIKPLVEAIVGKEGSSSKVWLKTANEQTRKLWKALPAEEKQKYTEIAQAINSGEASAEVKAKHGDRYFVDHLKQVVDFFHDAYAACLMVVTVRKGADGVAYVHVEESNGGRTFRSRLDSSQRFSFGVGKYITFSEILIGAVKPSVLGKAEQKQLFPETEFKIERDSKRRPIIPRQPWENNEEQAGGSVTSQPPAAPNEPEPIEAGSPASAASHWSAQTDFLRTLWSDRSYRFLIQLVKDAQNHSSLRMVNIPGVPIAHWASWSSHRRWTPPWIHDENGENWIVQFMDHFSTSADIYVHSIGVIEYFLLVCGLLVRDISEAQFSLGDPDEQVSGRYPPWIAGSSLQFSIVDLIAATVSKMWNRAKVLPRVHPLPQLPPGQRAPVSADPANVPLPKMGNDLDEGFIDPTLSAGRPSLSSRPVKVVAPVNIPRAAEARPDPRTTVVPEPAGLHVPNRDEAADKSLTHAPASQTIVASSGDHTGSVSISKSLPTPSLSTTVGDVAYLDPKPMDNTLANEPSTQPQIEGASAGTSATSPAQVDVEADKSIIPKSSAKRKPKARQPPRKKKTPTAAGVPGQAGRSNVEDQRDSSMPPATTDGNATMKTSSAEGDHRGSKARQPVKKKSAVPIAEPTDEADRIPLDEGGDPSNPRIVEDSTSTSRPPNSRQSDRLQAKPKLHWTLEGKRTTVDPQTKPGSSSKGKGSKKRQAAEPSAPEQVKRARSVGKRGGKQA